MFVIWGALHGGALLVHRLWSKTAFRLPRPVAWLTTFIFVNATWVFFRAASLDDAWRILGAMVDTNSMFENRLNLSLSTDLAWSGWLSDTLLHVMPSSLVGQVPVYLAIALAFILVAQKNTLELIGSGIGATKLVYGILLLTVAIQTMLTATTTVFLYFNF